MRGTAASTERDGGFTLLEMLVSLALLALILTVLAQMIFGARLALGFIDRRAAQGPVTAAQAYIRAAVSQARDFPELKAAGEVAFFGTANQMTFLSGHAPRGSYQGLYKVTLRVAANRTGANDLVADLQIARPPATHLQPATNSVPLVRNIQSVSFGYTANDGGTSSSWNTAVLPQLVTVRVRFPAGDRRRWDDLLIAPELSAASATSCPSRTTCD